MENRSVCEIREGGKLPTLSSSPLIKIRVFNWSKINLLFIFLYFIHFFLFWLCGFLALCSFIKSLLLVNNNQISIQVHLPFGKAY